MNVAVQQEDIELLNDILQERLLAEFPSVEGLQVKCALKNDELMILTQHSPPAIINTEQIFAVLEQALQWQLNTPSAGIKCFVRITGEKLPYAKHALKLSPPIHPTQPIEQEEALRALMEEDRQQQRFHDNFQPIEPADVISPVSEEAIPAYNPFTSTPEQDDDSFDVNQYDHQPEYDLRTEPEMMESEEKFDPFAGGPDLREKKTRKFPVLPQLPSLPKSPLFLPLAALVLIITIIVFGAGTYFLTSSCLMFKCRELETAEKLKADLSPLLRQAKSERELQSVKQQIDEAIIPLQNIPQWSPNHGLAEEMTTVFSEQSVKIQQVVTALQEASQAMQKTPSSTNSLEELKKQQNLWRQAITPLEAIKPSSDLYRLVHPKLPSYRQRLVAINQQLFTEESLVKKLDSVKEIVKRAEMSESTAKSANEWQKVESDWQLVVNSLKSIPQNSSESVEAIGLLTKYQPRLIKAHNINQKELLANQSYQKAVNLANQAKVEETEKNQLQAAVSSWQQAIQTAKQVPQDTVPYNQAQSLITTSSSALVEAQTKLAAYAGSTQQARADLSSTCNSGTQFCTFKIDDAKITVTLTAEYDQALQNPHDSSSMQNHLNKLREVLKVISENANRPLVLYNSQGSVMYERLSN